jgi:hypothetical protein
MHQKPATTRGLGLIRSGVPMRHAAVMAGVSLSTLLRACRRHGITLKRGRPPAEPVECFCDRMKLGVPGVSCGDCPSDYISRRPAKEQK